MKKMLTIITAQSIRLGAALLVAAVVCCPASAQTQSPPPPAPPAAAGPQQTEPPARAAAPDKEGIKERVASRLERIEALTGRRMTRGTGMLASIGATAPFVGLFGTVWGIMNSFIGISKSHTTNLAVVAPGIAEALLATALGLAAAIPAVVIYNVFARSIAGYRAGLGDAAAEVLRLVSRDLERAAVGAERACCRPSREVRRCERQD